MATVIKKDLAKKLRDKIPLTAEMSEEIIKTITSDIAESLVNGHRVELRGLGIFTTKHRKPGNAYNFVTGENLTVPGMLVVKFTTSAPLKRALNVY